MSNIDFDARSEHELAALESSTTGDLLRSAAQAIVPQSQFSGRLEAQLRALPVGRADAIGAPVSDVGSVSTERVSSRTTPVAGNRHSSSRIWRVASVGLGLAATLVLAFLMIGLLGSGRGGVSGGSSKDAFVPQGKVRHILFEDKKAQRSMFDPADTAVYTSQQEVWLANGTDHLKMFLPGATPGCCGRMWLLVGDTDVWFYLPPMGPVTDTITTRSKLRNIVFKTTFDPRQFNGIVPDKAVIDSLLQEPGFALSGDDQVNGRAAFIVKSTGLARSSDSSAVGGVAGTAIVGFSIWPETGYYVTQVSKNTQSIIAYDSVTGLPLSTPTLSPANSTPHFVVVPPKSSDQYRNEEDYRIWVDKETYRVLQIESTYRSYGGESDGVVSSRTRSIVKDELLDENAAPKGLFIPSVPDGVSVVDAYSDMVREVMPYADVPANSDKGASDDNTFVQQGKVRHITFTASTVVTGTVVEPADKNLSGSSSIEVWLANENGQILARHGNLSLGENWQLLTSDSFYDHPDPNSMTVYKYPYDIEHIRQIPYGALAAYILPDPKALAYLLAEPNALNLGDTTLNGHTVTVISAPATTPSTLTEYADAPYRAMVDHWYWVERSTSRILRVEAAFTIISGAKSGFRYGAAMELSQDEAKDRAALPADYFTFKAPSWATVVDAPNAADTPANETTTASTPVIPTSSDFLPDGKVRLITLEQDQVSVYTTGEVYTETTHVEQFWLAQGAGHPLMKTHVTVPTEALTWIDENNYYEYDPSQNDQLQTYPYDPKYQASVLPDPNIITSTLARPGAVSLGETTLDGKRALLIEVTGQNTSNAQSTPSSPSKGKVAPTPAEPANVEVEANTPFSTRYWIDLQTNQLLRVEILDVSPDGSTKKIINYIAQDVLIDRATLAADFFAPAWPADGVASLKVGDTAPDFTLTDVQTGKPVSLASLHGKPVVLYFWGTWCPPCQDSMPIAQSVYDSMKDKVTFVGISMGPRDTLDAVKDYLATNNYNWAFVHDADYNVADAYKISTVPAYVFIDANGTIKAIKVGIITNPSDFAHYLGQ